MLVRMSRWWEKSKDGFHNGLDGLTGCLGDLVGEVLVAVLACGLLALAWWGYRTAPYVTVPIGAGLLLFAGLGAMAWRVSGGGRLAGRLAVAATLAAGLVVGLLTYLPSCACLG